MGQQAGRNSQLRDNSDAGEPRRLLRPPLHVLPANHSIRSLRRCQTGVEVGGEEVNVT